MIAMYMPKEIDFDIAFEPTRMRSHKYVINTTTGEPVGIVGKDFKTTSHPDFFNGVMDTLTERLTDSELQDADIKWRTSHNGAWAMMDVTLPNVSARVVTNKHQVDVGERIIALRAVDGSCSNTSLFGAIDFFCLNGQIRGNHDKIRRKNTSGFSMTNFIDKLSRHNTDFREHVAKLQSWANKELGYTDVRNMLHSLMKSEKVGDKMLGLYAEEARTRGQNAYALYSAFTNYSTYADERNGYAIRNTGKDTRSMTMFNREQRVLEWTESKQFRELVAA